MSQTCAPVTAAQIEALIGFALAEAARRDPAPHLIGLSIEALQPLEAGVVFCIGETDELDEAFEYFPGGPASDPNVLFRPPGLHANLLSAPRTRSKNAFAAPTSTAGP